MVTAENSARAESTSLPTAPAHPFDPPPEDPPDHSRIRRLLTGHFTVRRVSRLGPRIEQLVQDELEAMERVGPPADLVQVFEPVPA